MAGGDVASDRTMASEGGPRFAWGGVTDVGGVREINEDAWIGSSHVCVVADGMGGHAAGEVASALVVQLAAEMFASGPVGVAELPSFVSGLNAAVLRRGDEDNTPRMGTTVVGVAMADNGASPSAVVFHVGDSRCYRLCNGILTQLTTDHSHVQELVAAGRISPAQALTHPLRNVITRALGAEVTVEADFQVLAEQECRLLLCSDGLTGEVDDDLIWDVLTAVPDPTAAAQRLVDLATTGRARDNVTAVVVDVSYPPVETFAPPAIDGRVSQAFAVGADEGVTAERTDVAEVTAEAKPSSTWDPPVPTDVASIDESRAPAPLDAPPWGAPVVRPETATEVRESGDPR